MLLFKATLIISKNKRMIGQVIGVYCVLMILNKEIWRPRNLLFAGIEKFQEFERLC